MMIGIQAQPERARKAEPAKRSVYPLNVVQLLQPLGDYVAEGL
jgi:hypothetical protein